MNYSVKTVYGKIKNNSVTVDVPGSKSITARALLIAALAQGKSTLKNVQFSDDCRTFLNCLDILGIKSRIDGTTVQITGCGGELKTSSAEIYVGSAGTAARFLPAFLAFQGGKYKLTCSEQMKKRPVKPLIDTLKSLGAKFTFLEQENSYPFIIEGTCAPKTEVEVDVTESSQFLSALLISSVCAGMPFKIKVNGAHGLDYVDMTLKMMNSFGVKPTLKDGVYWVNGCYFAKNYEIEPDVSAACYFYAANKILGTDIRVNGLKEDSLQGDVRFIEILKTFDGGKIDMRSFSDQTLTLAAIAPFFNKPTGIYGVEHIRGQECDRIYAAVSNLKALGVNVEERKDGLIIYPSKIYPAEIETFGDHRVAMSFALTGLRAEGVTIKNAEVCAKTFKEYFTVLDNLCKDLTR